MTSKSRLRIAIAVGDRRVPRWQAAAVSDACRIAGIEISVIRLAPDQEQRKPAAPSLRRLDRADYRITRRLTSVQDPLQESFIDLPIQTANFRKAHFDVVVDLCGNLRAARALMPRLAIWSMAFGKYLCPQDEYPCVEEVLAGDDVTSAFLLTRERPAYNAQILGEAHTAVDRHSIFVTRAQALWAAPQLITAALAQLAGGSLPAARPLPARKARPPLSVSGKTALDFALQALGHAWRSLIRRDEWQVHYRIGPDIGYKNPGLAGFTAIPRLKTGFLADPFVIEREGRTVIFGEEYPRATRRGVISCVELRDGKPLGEPVRVLERPYHLSYPFLMTEGAELFMIPETSANNTVELYRCLRFPGEWRLEAILLKGIKAADTTVARIDGRFWMFTAVKRPETRNFDELHLYSADELTGPWLPHAANPVRFDVRDSRPAGALFQDGESWIRPAQDGSLRYGRRIAFQRITALTAAAYTEEPAGLLDPGGVADFEGVHSWNRSENIGVIDSVRQVCKFGQTPA